MSLSRSENPRSTTVGRSMQKVSYVSNTWANYLQRFLLGSIDEEMNVTNSYDVMYTVRIKTGDPASATAMQAVIDTSMTGIVLELDSCATCSSPLAVGASVVKSGTAASGQVKNPNVTNYEGETGTVSILCMFDADQDATYTGTLNTSTYPCIDGLQGQPAGVQVNFASSVTTANTLVTGFIGGALSGDSPNIVDLFFDGYPSFEKKLAFNLFNDDFNAATADTSFVDLGSIDAASHKKNLSTAHTIQMD